MRESYIGESVENIAKRALALPAKLIGFKPCCLYLATWLLVTGRIGEWAWFAVLVTILFGIVGLKALGQIHKTI
ncbi:hypothetical protein [Teretinema zuelzerae]|uniref:hypothetical protein n=1 Tax=Teretinema zuelzerae TaxID=156 RepID=UPI001E40475B|nr:hypothetical protein [Teretinema zuelzerae]